MFGKLLSDTVAAVKTKTDEFKTNVRIQAARAVNEVLGLPHRPLSARELEQHLEREASYNHTLSSLCDMYARWLQQIVESSHGRVVFSDDRSPRSLPSDRRDVTAKSDASRQNVDSPEEPHGDPEEDVFKSPARSVEEEEAGNTDVAPPLLNLAERQFRNLTFKQVLLRSNALEISLATVAQLPDVRTALAGPAEEEEEESPRGLLQRLLHVCLRGDEKLHLELVFLFCTADATADDRHLLFLTELVSILKINWLDDYFFESRRHLATEIEIVKFDINHASNFPLVVEEESSHLADPPENADQMTLLAAADKHDARVALSLHLVKLYKDTLENLKTSACCRKDHHQKTMMRINAVMEKLGCSEKDYKAACSGASGRSSALQEQMLKAGEELVAKMMSLEKDREAVEAKISELESERQALIVKVDELSSKIGDLEDTLKQSLSVTNEHRKELDSVRRKFRSKMATEDSMKLHSEARQQDLQNIQTVTSQTELQLDSILKALAEDVDNKSNKICGPSRDLLGKHLKYEKARMQHHNDIVKYFVHQVTRLNGEIEACQKSLAEGHQVVPAVNPADTAEPTAATYVDATDPSTTDAAPSGSTPDGATSSADGSLNDTLGHTSGGTNLASRLRYLKGLQMEARHKLARSFSQLEDMRASVDGFRLQHLENRPTAEVSAETTYIASEAAKAATDSSSNDDELKLQLQEIDKLYKQLKSEVVAPNLHLLEVSHGSATSVSARHKSTSSALRSSKANQRGGNRRPPASASIEEKTADTATSSAATSAATPAATSVATPAATSVATPAATPAATSDGLSGDKISTSSTTPELSVVAPPKEALGEAPAKTVSALQSATPTTNN